MDYRQLGQTGIYVSKMCFGSLTISPLQAALSINEGADLIRYALEQGVNFIDTAKLYKNYPYLKKALKGWDKPVVIASKSYDYTWEGMKKSIEEARLAIDRDYIDIFMLHEQESELTLKGHAPAIEYMLEAKAKGYIKAVGVSTHTVEVVRVAAEREDIEVIHPIVNYKGLGLLDGTLEDLLIEIKKAYNNKKGIYGMKPLGGGNLLGHVDEALDFAFNLPFLHSVAIGCQRKEELDYNLAMMYGQEPSKVVKEMVRSKKRRLLIEDYCEGCGACIEKCPYGLLTLKNEKAHLDKEGCVLCGYCGAVCPQFAIKIV